MIPEEKHSAILEDARRALRILFDRPDGTANEFSVDRFLRLFEGALTPDAGYANALWREFGRREFGGQLEERLLEALIENRVLPADLAAPEWSENLRFLLTEAASLLKAAVRLPEAMDAAERRMLLPAASEFFHAAAAPENLRELADSLRSRDRFRADRAFRYIGGKFIPADPGAAKPLKKFFGFPSIRAQFQRYFREFAEGKINLPLLIYSLPGHGKTSLTISHVLAEPDLVLILPEVAALESGWNELIAPLAARPDHKFVLFFDDIDPRTTDWYSFRTNVGGAFTLPDNVMPVLASNYEFPASILSRGRQLSFPIFDELRCIEMVEDFLTDFGLKRINHNLVLLIAADYTEEFGQKKFTELSPRSLTRYLEIYQKDRIKRKTIVELSLGPMITRPDSQLFYEFNIDLMRSLYGDDYIKKLLKQRLKDLEG